MAKWTVYLFRSGRVWTRLGEWRKPIANVEQPLLTEVVDADTDYAALGKVLLQQVDRANQPFQHVCVCEQPCCSAQEVCECGQIWSQHSFQAHTFIPRPHQPPPYEQ